MGDVNLIVMLIIAILLPPLAIFLKYECDIVKLVISIILCIFFWLPGSTCCRLLHTNYDACSFDVFFFFRTVIYAVLHVLDKCPYF